MSNAWDHLPNAKYIDLVLESLTANPDEWSAAWDAARDTAWDAAWAATQGAARIAARTAARDAAMTATRTAAWDAAMTATRDAAMTATRDAAMTATRDAAWYATRDAIAALIAHDDCAHMLDSEPDDLRILSKLGSHAATLMIPAAVVFKSIRQKELSVL